MKLGLKNIVFSFYSAGVILDHLTTSMGMSVGLKESNMFTCYLIENGLWVYADITLFIILIAIINFFNDKLAPKNSRAVLIFPLLSGFMRMVAGALNMVLLFYL